jgi:hypothetical protein
MKKFLLGFAAFLIAFSSISYAEESASPTKDAITIKLEKVLYPCVRVLNGSGGGSGTVVYSEDRENTGDFQTFVVTNHHVVDNLIKVTKVWDNLTKSYRFEEQNDLAEVEMFQYANGGRTVTKFSVKADIIAYITDEDIALLKLRHPFQIPFVAKVLPTGQNLRLFQEIYAVGCPLLVDPMFTKGEITDLDNLIDNKSYTGGTANIIWGNSGGAVVSEFPDGEWYFCGIPARGYGAPNGQFVTYLGYYVSADRIRGFIASQKLEFLIDTTKTPVQCMEERAKMQKRSDEGPGSKAGDQSPQNAPPGEDGTKTKSV